MQRHLEKTRNLRYVKMMELLPPDLQSLLDYTYFPVEERPPLEIFDQVQYFLMEENYKIKIRKASSKKAQPKDKQCCIGCHQQNFEVPGFGQRHLCLFCREELRTKDGRKVTIFKENNL